MIKLSELDKDTKVMYGESIYTVEEVRNDLRYFTDDEDKRLYTTTESHASIDAKDMLETAIENEYCDNMYEDWDEKILDDVTGEDIEKMQAILDDIFSRNKEQNISYREDEEIEIDELD